MLIEVHSSPEVHYILPSNEKEHERLNRQHISITRLYGGELFLPPIALSSGDQVLDAGTGNGIWALDLAKIVPESVEIFAIDIEPRLFPQDTPENIHFSKASVTHLPKEWDGKFAFLHQRLLILALRKHEWRLALAEMYRVVAPGGWVQLGEAGSWVAGPKTRQFRAVIEKLFETKDMLMDCAIQLPVLLREAGFVNVHCEAREIRLGQWAGEAGVAARDNCIEVFRGSKRSIMEAGGLGMSSEGELDSLIDAVGREWNDSVGAATTFSIIYAQRGV